MTRFEIRSAELEDGMKKNWIQALTLVLCAALLAEAVGEQLTCVFVDHGLLRKDEGDQVEAVYAYCNLHGLWKA